MKKFLCLLAVGIFCLTGYSQTIGLNTNTSPPSLTLGQSLDSVLGALTTATNWAVAPFMLYVRDKSKHEDIFGGGVAALYNISPNAATMLRYDQIGKDAYMVAGNLQLQLPFSMFNGNVRSTPFGFVGGGQQFGQGQQFVGIAGAGWDFKFPKLSSHWSVAFDAEYWSDRPGLQWRFSPFVFRF